jgi:hypothetical protein
VTWWPGDAPSSSAWARRSRTSASVHERPPSLVPSGRHGSSFRTSTSCWVTTRAEPGMAGQQNLVLQAEAFANDLAALLQSAFRDAPLVCADTAGQRVVVRPEEPVPLHIQGEPCATLGFRYRCELDSRGTWLAVEGLGHLVVSHGRPHAGTAFRVRARAADRPFRTRAGSCPPGRTQSTPRPRQPPQGTRHVGAPHPGGRCPLSPLHRRRRAVHRRGPEGRHAPHVASGGRRRSAAMA